MKVLLVDDDVDMLEVTTYALRREGYTVLGATNGQQALQRWATEAPDILLLDVNLPKVNGFDVCRQVRHESQTPVILLTASGDEEDILRGFRLGADDYIIKPYSPRQLAARMKAVLRRCQADPYREPVGELRVGDLTLDLQTHEVRKGSETVQLTPLEFRILYLLAVNAGRVIPHARLIDYAWDYDGGDASLLKTHICHIRRKLSLSANQPGGIRVVVGVGYSLAKP